MPLEESR